MRSLSGKLFPYFWAGSPGNELCLIAGGGGGGGAALVVGPVVCSDSCWMEDSLYFILIGLSCGMNYNKHWTRNLSEF